MINNNSKSIFIFRFLALTGIIAVIFYVAHVIGGRIIWRDYNPYSQPISDLTATSAISQPVASQILWGYNIFNLLFCGILLVIFGLYRQINKIFYSGLILKSIAEVLSTFGYLLFPLSDTTWEHSFQNTMHYVITGVIVLGYIVLSILLAIGLSKNKQHPQMTLFLIVFSVVFIVSGFATVVATQVVPSYAGLIERVNLYSLMVLNITLALWTHKLV